jgi:hypothetical protein
MKRIIGLLADTLDITGKRTAEKIMTNILGPVPEAIEYTEEQFDTMNSLWDALAENKRFGELSILATTMIAEKFDIPFWKALLVLEDETLSDFMPLVSSGFITKREVYSEEQLSVLAEVFFSRFVVDQGNVARRYDSLQSTLELLEERLRVEGEDSIRAEVEARISYSE